MTRPAIELTLTFNPHKIANPLQLNRRLPSAYKFMEQALKKAWMEQDKDAFAKGSLTITLD